jgi:hypothetical protein
LEKSYQKSPVLHILALESRILEFAVHQTEISANLRGVKEANLMLIWYPLHQQHGIEGLLQVYWTSSTLTKHHANHDSTIDRRVTLQLKKGTQPRRVITKTEIDTSRHRQT